MKAIVGLVSSILLAFSAQAQSGISIGDGTVAGNACKSVNVVETGGTEDTLQISLRAWTYKSSSAELERGSCSFAVPIRVAKGHRLIIRDLVAFGKVDLSAGARSTHQLEIFAAGSQGEILKRVEGSSTKRVKKNIQLRRDGELLVTECGADINLRGNASILLQGNARASGGLSLIVLGVEVERCW